MTKKILLDNKEFHITTADLPILIHGKDGSGASLCTITMLADLYAQGKKVVGLTGFSMAREEFIKQTTANENAQLFTLEQQNEFVNIVSQISNNDDYVVLVKNIELLHEDIVNSIKHVNNRILSGDINKCPFQEKLLQETFTTKIYFSTLDKALPELQKYQGLLISKKNNGIVSLEDLT